MKKKTKLFQHTGSLESQLDDFFEVTTKLIALHGDEELEPHLDKQLRAQFKALKKQWELVYAPHRIRYAKMKLFDDLLHKLDL
jgi:hypothetical protein